MTMTEALPAEGLRKAAVLLVQLGQENASRVLSFMSEGEVEAISAEIASLDALSAGETESVLAEFRDMTSAQLNIMRGGPDFARALLTESRGPRRGGPRLGGRRAAAQKRARPVRQPPAPPPPGGFIQGEHPQVIAVVLAHLRSEKASIVLSGLDPLLQADVAHRIAVMDQASPDALQRVEERLERKMSSVLQPAEMSKVGGLDPLIQIINRADRATERLIVDGLVERDPELAEEVKSRMFMFEDITLLEDKDVQLVLRQVDNADLAMALKGVNDEVRAKVTSNMSERAATTLLEDVELLGAVLLRQVEEAQQKVILVIRRLEESGEITLRRGADDEYVV